MVKQLLTFATVAMLSVGANAETLELSLSDLGSGWGSSYDPATKTITFDGAWNGRGWWFGDMDYSKYDEVVVNFEKVDFNVQVVVEYTKENGAPSSTAVASAGKESVKCELSAEGKSNVMQVYLQPSAAGTLTLTSAYFQNAEVFDPTKNVTVWEGSTALVEWGNNIQIPCSDFTAEKIAVGDKIAVSYEAAEAGGSFKVVYVAQEWQWTEWPAFLAVPGVQKEYGTLWVTAPGTIEIEIDEAALEVLKNERSILAQGDGVTITKFEIIRATTAVNEIGVDNTDAPVEYFNLQGVRVNNPANGLYIRRQGNDVKKVLVK